MSIAPARPQPEQSQTSGGTMSPEIDGLDRQIRARAERATQPPSLTERIARIEDAIDVLFDRDKRLADDVDDVDRHVRRHGDGHSHLRSAGFRSRQRRR